MVSKGCRVDVRVPDQDIGNVEVDSLRMKIGSNEANDFAASSGLGQQVLIAVKHIAEPHAVGVGHAARANDVAREIDGALAVGQNRLDANAISISYLRRSKQGLDLREDPGAPPSGKVTVTRCWLASMRSILMWLSEAAAVNPPASSTTAPSMVSPGLSS